MCLHSSTHFWIYSVDEKRLLCPKFFSNTFSLLIFLCIPQCVRISILLPVKLLPKPGCNFQVRCTFFMYFFFLLRKEKEVSDYQSKDSQSPYKEALRAQGQVLVVEVCLLSFVERFLHIKVTQTQREVKARSISSPL